MAGRPRIRAGQLVVAELAVVVLVAASTGPAWVFVAAVAIAFAVFVATFGRGGGRWWFEAIVDELRFRRRRRIAAAHVVAAALDRRTPPRVMWLRTLASTLTVRPVRLGAAADATVGVGCDAHGWFPAVPIRPGSSPYGHVAALLRRAPDRVAVSVVQVVVVPDPGPAWLAVRLSPADAVAVERAGGVAAVERVVAAAALRCARMLHTRPLDVDGVLTALVAATGLDGPPQEHWTSWRSGSLAQACFELSGWSPAVGTLAPAVQRLAVSYTATRTAAFAMVGAEPAHLAQACQELVRLAALAQVVVRRLDGEHALGAYACAPTAIATVGWRREIAATSLGFRAERQSAKGDQR